MPSQAFTRWLKRFSETGEISPVKLGTTREELCEVLGDPDDFSADSSNRLAPQIYKYGSLEFHFGPKPEDGLELIYRDDAEGIVRVCISRNPGAG